MIKRLDFFIAWFRPEDLMSDDDGLYRRLVRFVDQKQIDLLYNYLDFVADGWILAEFSVIKTHSTNKLTWKILAVRPKDFKTVSVTGAGSN